MSTILPLLAKCADLRDQAAPLEVWEEIKSEPAVMCERLAPSATLTSCQLQDGDILVLQLALDEVRPMSSMPQPGGVWAGESLHFCKQLSIVTVEASPAFLCRCQARVDVLP